MKKTSVDIELGPCSIKRAGMLQFSIFQSINNMFLPDSTTKTVYVTFIFVGAELAC